MGISADEMFHVEHALCKKTLERQKNLLAISYLARILAFDNQSHCSTWNGFRFPT